MRDEMKTTESTKSDDVPFTPNCVGCGRSFRTGDVEFGVAGRGLYHVGCGKHVPSDATIETVGVFVESRHVDRMPGSARKRFERAKQFVPSIVATLVQARKIRGAVG